MEQGSLAGLPLSKTAALREPHPVEWDPHRWGDSVSSSEEVHMSVVRMSSAIAACDNKWGYVVKDATTCQRDGTAILAMGLGLGFGFCAIVVARSLIAARR
jgi:hypothetical protein